MKARRVKKMPSLRSDAAARFVAKARARGIPYARARRPWRDPDDALEITEKWVAEADFYRGKKLVRPESSTVSEGCHR